MDAGNGGIYLNNRNGERASTVVWLVLLLRLAHGIISIKLCV